MTASPTAALRFCLLALICACSLSMHAQTNLSEADRDRWLKEIRTYKHDFITRELELTNDQVRQFFPQYDKMEDEIAELNAATREAEARVNSDKDATDLDIENTARSVFELKRAEGQIEMTYFEVFKDILTPRQLLQLKNTERKFTQQLVKHHRRNRTQR